MTASDPTHELFRPTATVESLRARAALLRACRDFFDARGFIEVQTPILSQDVVIDRHLDPLLVSVSGETSRHAGHSHRFLQTSPEQNMKRLLTLPIPAIYQLGPVFRAAEFGEMHNPEFTMLEWYRVGDDLEAGIQLLESLIQETLSVPHCQRMTYRDAFQRWLGVDALEAEVSSLAQIAITNGWVESQTWSTERDDWLNLLFSYGLQPRLGWEVPLVITHFPATQAALARISSEDSRTAERFEIFYRGVELANGFHELLDPIVLEERNRIANTQRSSDGKGMLPEANWLLDAMRSGIPACTGCALGFDRLAMLVMGAKRLSEVLCFPWDRA
jgi:elongation factor P--(R)-beta-lysine ligase